jgi:hypothetical protein
MIGMGDKEVVEEWILVSSLDGGYERFPKRSLLGLSEYIKKEKEKNPDIRIRVIITGGVLGFLPGYITKGAVDSIKALQENILTINDMVVATKPHLMRIVDNVDEVYYFAGIEDKRNINEIYSALLYYFRRDPSSLWDILTGLLFHELEIRRIVQQTEFSREVNKHRLEKTIKEIEKYERRLKDTIDLISSFRKDEIKEEYKDFAKEWIEKLEEEKKEIQKKLQTLRKEKEKYEKELLNTLKKIELNNSELEDCRRLQYLLEEVLSRHYLESGKDERSVERELNEILTRIRTKTLNGEEVSKKIREIASRIIEQIKEERKPRIGLSELEKQRNELDKRRREIEEKITNIEKEISKLTNEEREAKLKEIEKLKEESEKIQKQLKEVAEKIKKELYSQQPKYPKTSSFEEVTGNIRGKSDVGKIIWELALAEYLFYLRNVLGRRSNVKIILNTERIRDELGIIFQNSFELERKKVKVITNLSPTGAYITNSLKLATANVDNEDFVFFANSSPILRLVPSSSSKGYTVVVGVPPLVDSEIIKDEQKQNIGSKYSLQLSKRMLLPSAISLRFYENERIGFVVLKEQFLFALANKRIEEEAKYLESINVSYSGEKIKDRVEKLHILNKLPSELSEAELSMLQNPKELLVKYSSNVKGDLREVEYYLIADAHVGGAPVIDLTKPSSEELLFGAGKIVSEDMKRNNADIKVLAFLGDMIEGLEYGITESQIPELLGEFERWLESKKISEETKEKAKLSLAYLAQQRMERLKYGPIASIVEPFSNAIVNADKVVIISGNHQPKISESKKTTEADLIYEYSTNNIGVEPIKMIKAPGEEFGGIQLKVNFGEKEENVLFVHKYYLHNLSKDPSKHVFSGHFHEFLSIFTTNGWLIQTGALASANAYVIQQGIPHSEQLRGFSEVKVSYIGKEEAKVEIQPVLIKEITKASKVEEVGEKAFGKEESKEIMQLIKEFIVEKVGIVVEEETKEKEVKKEEPKGLLRFIDKGFEIREEEKKRDFQPYLREKSKKSNKAKDQKITNFF